MRTLPDSRLSLSSSSTSCYLLSDSIIQEVQCLQVHLKQIQERGFQYKLAGLMAGSAGPVMAWALRLIPPECSTDPFTHPSPTPGQAQDTVLCPLHVVKLLTKDTVGLDLSVIILPPTPKIYILVTCLFQSISFSPEDSSVSKGICFQTWLPEFRPQGPHGRRKPTPASSSLTSIPTLDK